MFSHLTITGLFQTDPFGQFLLWSPLRLFFAGHQAVVLFFVISGYALAKLSESIGPGRYGTFALARFLRLYPPYLVSLAVALYGTYVLTSHGMKSITGFPLPTAIYIQSLFVVGSFDARSINPPVWSIVYETRLSLLFPLILFAVRRFGIKTLFGFFIASILIGTSDLSLSASDLLTPTHDAFMTVHYGTFFAIGAWISLHEKDVIDALRARRTQTVILMWAAALLMIAYAFDGPWTVGQRVYGDLVIGIGSAIAVGLAVAKRPSSFGFAGGRLGKISYSLYLVHLTIVNLAVSIIFPKYGAMATWLIATVAALALAVIVNRLVEQPSQKAARYFRGRTAGQNAKALRRRSVS
jgi:peptidoglycan/LPS O-acetylase OafA/YrhL